MFKSISTVLGAAAVAASWSIPASAMMIVPKSLDFAVLAAKASTPPAGEINWFSFVGNLDELVGSPAQAPLSTADIKPVGKPIGHLIGQSSERVVGPLSTARDICQTGA